MKYFNIIFILCGLSASGFAQISRQITGGEVPVPMEQHEVSALGDPFFTLVLREHPNVTSLGEILDAIQPDEEKRKLFVVSEQLQSAHGNSRRMVIAFEGVRDGEDLRANVMLSGSLSKQGFPEDLGFLEAWGWDNHRGRYNYYRLDTARGEELPTWKFRGSSVDADLRSPVSREGTCFACHVNGAPMMKELQFPWNNWFSESSGNRIGYLDQLPIDGQWPVARDSSFRRMLEGAESLEADIFSAIKRFNLQRINDSIRRDDFSGNRVAAEGAVTVIQGKRLLRPLFEPTELNLISSRDRSGSHPLSPESEFDPTSSIRLPSSFFLDSLLIGGGPGIGGGLGIAEARDFDFSLTQRENRQLLENSEALFADRSDGDASFAWFVPERSFIDNSLVMSLVEQQMITPELVAAILAIDIERPIFSERRASLLRHVPDRFDTSGGDLVEKIVESIEEGGDPEPSSPEEELLQNLTADDPLELLREKVIAYRDEVASRLEGEASVRFEELTRLYGLAVEKRQALQVDPVFHHLDETRGRFLFPLPPRF